MKTKFILIVIVYFIVLFGLAFLGLYIAEGEFSQTTKTIGLISTLVVYAAVAIAATFHIWKNKIYKNEDKK